MVRITTAIRITTAKPLSNDVKRYRAGVTPKEKNRNTDNKNTTV